MNAVGLIAELLILLVFSQQGSQHILIGVVVVGRPAATSVTVTVLGFRFQMLVAILLSDTCLFSFDIQLLLALLFDHVAGTLVQAQTPLCLHFLFDEGTEPLGWLPSGTRGCRPCTIHGMVLLSVIHVDFGTSVEGTTSTAHLWLIAASSIHRSLTILATVLLVPLVVRIHILLLHA